jgi:hypothetical protein
MIESTTAPSSASSSSMLEELSSANDQPICNASISSDYQQHQANQLNDMAGLQFGSNRWNEHYMSSYYGNAESYYRSQINLPYPQPGILLIYFLFFKMAFN